jgi:type IV secretion system protein VirB10
MAKGNKSYDYFVPDFGEEESGKKKRAKNYPRSTRIIWIIAAALGGIIALVIFSMEDPNANAPSGSTKPPEEAGIMPATGFYSDSSAIRERIYQNLKDEIIESRMREISRDMVLAAPIPTPPVSEEPKSNVRVVVKPPSEALEMAREMKLSALAAAPMVELGNVEMYSSDAGAEGEGVGGSPSASNAGETLSNFMNGLDAGITDVSPLAAGSAQGGGDSNATAMAHQDRADQFVQQNTNRGGTTADGEYLSSGRTYPRGKYELKAGSVINGVMMGGINSDLPGTIVGQISGNVYDTATGAHLLIPQGSRMTGAYDSHVVYGQNRLLVVWQRVIFPDGTSINLEGMLGSDPSGYAGFKQKTDHHYSRMLGAAIFASVFVAAGKEVTKDDTSTTTGSDGENRSTESIFAETVMENVTNVATQMIEKNMNIAPTLRILPGYRFSIITTKDITFAEPYVMPANGGAR